MEKEQLQKLSAIRLEEAQHLLSAGLWSGAYYLGGYAVELALKACIAGQFKSATIPDRRFVERVHTHDLERLVEIAGLHLQLNAKLRSDPVFERNWQYAIGWSERARYVTIEQPVAAVFLNALSDGDHGVITWIQDHW